MKLVEHRPQRSGDKRVERPPEVPADLAVGAKGPEQKGSQYTVLENVCRFTDDVIEDPKGVVACVRYKPEQDFVNHAACM